MRNQRFLFCDESLRGSGILVLAVSFKFQRRVLIALIDPARRREQDPPFLSALVRPPLFFSLHSPSYTLRLLSSDNERAAAVVTGVFFSFSRRIFPASWDAAALSYVECTPALATSSVLAHRRGARARALDKLPSPPAAPDNRRLSSGLERPRNARRASQNSNIDSAILFFWTGIFAASNVKRRVPSSFSFFFFLCFKKILR